MRALLVLLVLAASLVPSATSDASVRLPCWWGGSAGPIDGSCVPPIHPGARSSACTLNWIVTDGVDLFVGAAQHCTGAIGQPLFVEGVSESVGTLAWKGRNDSAFYRIDPEDRPLVSGALEGWGGPSAGPTGQTIRTPVPGETALMLGHGYVTEPYAPLRGRAMPVAYAYSTHWEFILAGSASGGDSGSPVMLATGEALGFVSAGLFVQNLFCGQLSGACDGIYTSQGTIGVQLATELAHFARDHGRPLSLVTGEPTLSGP